MGCLHPAQFPSRPLQAILPTPLQYAVKHLQLAPEFPLQLLLPVHPANKLAQLLMHVGEQISYQRGDLK